MLYDQTIIGAYTLEMNAKSAHTLWNQSRVTLYSLYSELNQLICFGLKIEPTYSPGNQYKSVTCATEQCLQLNPVVWPDPNRFLDLELDLNILFCFCDSNQTVTINFQRKIELLQAALES